MSYPSKNVTTLFFITLSIATHIFAMNGYEYIARLNYGSLLKDKCLLCQKTPFFKGKIEKQCDFINEKLKTIATTGGARMSSGNSYFSGIFNYAEFAAQDANAQKNEHAINIILANSSPEIRQQEHNELCELAKQLALEYDARILAKQAYKETILEELLLDEQKQLSNKVNKNSIKPHIINERYPHISSMPDISNTPETAQLKYACLNSNKTWRVRRACDQIEHDYKKVAETGCIKIGFLSTTHFEDKTKEHEDAINTILPNESEYNKFAELIRANAYASKLKKIYETNYDLKRKLESEQRWQNHLFRRHLHHDLLAQR